MKAAISTIILIINYIPMVARFINKLYEAWIDRQIKQVEKEYINKTHKRMALLKAIKNSKNEDEVKILSVMLADLK